MATTSILLPLRAWVPPTCSPHELVRKSRTRPITVVEDSSRPYRHTNSESFSSEPNVRRNLYRDEEATCLCKPKGFHRTTKTKGRVGNPLRSLDGVRIRWTETQASRVTYRAWYRILGKLLEAISMKPSVFVDYLGNRLNQTCSRVLRGGGDQNKCWLVAGLQHTHPATTVAHPPKLYRMIQGSSENAYKSKVLKNKWSWRWR